MKTNLWFLMLLSILFFSCSREEKQNLTKVHVTNQKGFIETITNKERLKEFENETALSHQPHKKIVRVYKKGKENRMVITTYHPNGQLYQLLESVGNTAHGHYKEWYSNGILKIQAFVIRGIPDIDISGQNSWTFEGKNEAFDQEGRIAAFFNYVNGELVGDSIVYYPSGQIKEIKPYQKNRLNGTVQAFDQDGSVLEKTPYEMGVKVGYSYKYWKKNRPASEERFQEGLLDSGVYFDPMGKLLAQIKNGSGKRALFQEDRSFELHEYINGKPEGVVEIFDKEGFLTNCYHSKNGVKNGLEIVFFPKSQQKMLSIEWADNKIHGKAKTWYLNGNLESEKDMSMNKKQGISTAWYRDGDLMLIEEYDSNNLTKGKYFEKGKTNPISTLSNGQGLVTLFDEKGIFMKKIEYSGGKPVE